MPIPNIGTAWKADLYKYVGKAFDFEYNNKLNKLRSIISEVDSHSIDYQLDGLGGYGEFTPYDGSTLEAGEQKRGFRTIIIPKEFSKTVDIGYKHARVDKLGETRKVGTRLGYGGAMTVYLSVLRMFGNAFDEDYKGGDGQPWASDEHPIASKGDNDDRSSVIDGDAGTFSNLIEKNLSVAAISDAQKLAGRYVTPDGLPFLCDFDTLLVSPELETKAREICGPNSRLIPEGLPETDLNDANPLYGMGYVVVGGGDDGFTANQWAVCDRTLLKEVAHIIYITRPTVLQGELDNPLISRYVGYIDYGVGWGDARPIVFSTGE